MVSNGRLLSVVGLDMTRTGYLMPENRHRHNETASGLRIDSHAQ